MTGKIIGQRNGAARYRRHLLLAFFLAFWHGTQGLAEFKKEKNAGEGHGQHICHRLRHKDSLGQVSSVQVGHHVDQRQQQNKLAHHRHDDGRLGVAQGGKCHLTGDLNTKQPQRQSVNAQHRLGKGQQFCVRGEDGGKHAGEQLDQQAKEHGVANATNEQQSVRAAYAVAVSGAVIVKDNKDDGLNDNSIVLGGDNACIAAIGQLAETADLQVRRSDAAAGKIIVKVGTDANGTALTTMENILAHVHYLDTTEYTINNQTGALESVTAPVSTMTLTADSISWNKAYEHTVDLTFHTNDAGVGGRYYVTWVKKSDSTPGFEAVKSNYKSSGDIASSASVQLTDVAYDTAIKVVVYAEDSKGLEAVAPLVLTLKAKASTPTETPITTTPTPTTRATINPSVSESKVTGLEKALAFYPKQMYNFTVTGAGTDNTNPIKGDTKWIPYGWSMSAKNIDTGYQKSWSIGNVNGIKQAKTFRMYIFFQKYIYNGSEWEATGVKEALPTEFKSKAIDFTVTPSGTITPTATAGSGSGGYDYNGTGSGDGDGTDGDDAENHDGTDSDTGSTSATNARTADNSPIATMMMLASLSLVAGGYVIVRKRKKEI
jgi:hypothetical protein